VLTAREVNMLALQSFPTGRKNVTRFIVDDPKTAKTVLVNEGLTHTEEPIVHVRSRIGPARSQV
jgi:hypothetical protein